MKHFTKYTFLFLLVICLSTYAYGSEQTPWQTNQNGTLYPRTIAWNYTMGYSFVPQKDGQITRLWGFFEGSKTIRLWDKNTRQVLASAVVVGKFG